MAALAGGPEDRGIIGVFAKPPVPGRVKTRLAASIGADAAAALAGAFFVDVVVLASSLVGSDLVVSTTDPGGVFPWLSASVPRWEQGDGDLGDRLERDFFRRGLARRPWVIALGADCPGLPRELLRQATRALGEGADAVIGPTLDGGFYLLGLRRCPIGLFADLPWSEAGTFDAMLARLGEHGLAPTVLDPWMDVDEVEDLVRLRRLLDQGRVVAEATRRALAQLDLGDAPRGGVSAIVPAFREAGRIAETARSLRDDQGFDEVIVVDGLSDDGTAQAARGVDGVTVVSSARGRAAQMNAGARVATGDTLAFVHADVVLPKGAKARMVEALAQPDIVGGAFMRRTVPDGGPAWAAPFLRLADIRPRLSKVAYGDQAIFVRRQTFLQVGGFPAVPLMEDIALSRRLLAVGRMARLLDEVQVSGRRVVARPVFYTAIYHLYPWLYRFGVPPRVLARWYAAVR